MEEKQISNTDEIFNEEKPLKTINLEINSKIKEKYSINIIGYESCLEIKIKTLNNEPNKGYEERFSLNNIKKINKYFLICESIIEVISLIEINIKQSNIIEDKNNINFIIPINHPLCKEIIFQIKEKIKIFTSSELYNMILDLRNNISELRNKNQILTERVNILENKLKEKDEIREPIQKEKKISGEKIKSSEEEEVNKYRSLRNNNDNSYNVYNIELKEPIHQLYNHTNYVYCSTLLRDRRFATGSLDHSIIIYNNKTFKPDITIKEHNSHVYCIIQLSCGLLASCSDDKTIKLYDINGNNYSVMQTLNDHTDTVFHIIELNNKKLVSCSSDETIKFYNIDDNNKYKLDYSINTKGFNGPVIQTKDNEICYQECIQKNDSICFYDLIKKKVSAKLDNIHIPSYIFNCMIMIKKDLLLVSGHNELYIININSYELIRTIDSSGSGCMVCNLLLNENILLTGDNNGRLIQWKIENDNLQRFSIKEKAHDGRVNTLLKIGNGLILTASDDKIVKIW